MKRIVSACSLTLLLVLSGAGCTSGIKPIAHTAVTPPFVAEDSDFADFTRWTTYDIAISSLSELAYPLGSRQVFLNRRPEAGATVYPEGTVLVKAIENDSVPQNWELFGMAKRGGDYDVTGAVGWEFFRLRVDAEGTTQIVSRGLTPTDIVDGGVSAASAGDGGLGDGGAEGDMAQPNDYSGAGAGVPCNICHGQPAWKKGDYTIAAQLDPSVTGQ